MVMPMAGMVVVKIFAPHRRTLRRSCNNESDADTVYSRVSRLNKKSIVTRALGVTRNFAALFPLAHFTVNVDNWMVCRLLTSRMSGGVGELCCNAKGRTSTKKSSTSSGCSV